MVFKQQTYRTTVGVHTGMSPSRIVHQPQQPSIWELSVGTSRASCMGCLNPMCMKFLPGELRLSDERVNEVPIEIDDYVCPTNAIVWERGKHTPTIVANRCINCGICARRCPSGAIYSDGTSAVIHFGDKEVDFRPSTPENTEVHERQIQELLDCPHLGQYCSIDDASIENVYTKLIDQKTGIQFPNLIVRNFFLVLGNRCTIPRRGLVFFRADGIIESKDNFGLIEVEFHNEILEQPRAILDDIAVLHSRYGIEKNLIKPFIVVLEFPNLRTEYWRVLKDIRAVLDIRIHSLTLGALCILTWSFLNVSLESTDFYADIDTPSIRQEIERLCGKVQLPDIAGRAVFGPTK